MSSQTNPNRRGTTTLASAPKSELVSGSHQLHIVASPFSDTEFGPLAPLTPLPVRPNEERYLGIPNSLVLMLVDVYYDNVYNASLLLHKQLFLQSIAQGTARSHIILSVCAWAAKYVDSFLFLWSPLTQYLSFYQDLNGQTTLKDHGFMKEWAQRAGKLVFQEAEELHDDNIVTFCNLSLFWHSKGQWRVAHLHKGNACQLLQIIGLGSSDLRTENSLEAEIRRRRFWACYLMHCQNSERLSLFESGADMLSLPLPWPEDEFIAGVSKSPRAFLQSDYGNGGLFAELIKVLTIW